MSNSISDSCSPSTSALMIAVNDVFARHGRGVRFRVHRVGEHLDGHVHRLHPDPRGTRGSELPTILLVQSKSLPRSSCGTPRISAIACNGKLGCDVGDEVAPTFVDHVVDDLAAPAAHLLFEEADDTRRERGRDDLRYRVCCGGSIISIIVPTPPSGPMSGSITPPDSASGDFSEEYVCQSRDTATTSSYLVATQKPFFVALGVGRRVEPQGLFPPEVREPLVRERILETVHVGEVDVTQLHGILLGAGAPMLREIGTCSGTCSVGPAQTGGPVSRKHGAARRRPEA